MSASGNLDAFLEANDLLWLGSAGTGGFQAGAEGLQGDAGGFQAGAGGFQGGARGLQARQATGVSNEVLDLEATALADNFTILDVESSDEN